MKLKLLPVAAVLALSVLVPVVWTDSAGEQIEIPEVAKSAEVEKSAEGVKSHVLTLSHLNFDEVVTSKKLLLMKFYAPWCGFCKKIAPEFENAAAALHDEKISLGKIDCTVPDHEPICSKYDIKGFPTLKIYRYGDHSEYKGPREAGGIISFMKRQNLPPVSEVTKDNITQFIDSEDVVVIGFLDAKSDQYKTFEKVANKLREKITFGATLDAEVAEKHGAKVPGVVLFKKFDDKKAIFSKDTITEEDLESFVRTESRPVMDEIGPDNYMEYMDVDIPLGYYFYGDAEQRKSYGPLIANVAKDFKGKVNFVYIDAEKYGGHADSVGLTSNWPAFGISDTNGNLKYPYDQSKEITEEGIRQFVQDLVDGKLEPSYKSAAVPDNTGKPVVEIVHSTYHDIVFDKEKDVFVKFYAPWCGHCKSLAPIWEKLGEHFTKLNHNIVIAKFDATENDIPKDAGFAIKGFPTLKLIKANTNTVVEFKGERNMESLVTFLKENAVHNDFEEPVIEPASEPKEEASEEHELAPEIDEVEDEHDASEETPEGVEKDEL